MDAGTMAAYARPYQIVDFVERNPVVIDLSVPRVGAVPMFTFVRDAKMRGATVGVHNHELRAGSEKLGDDFFRFVVVSPHKSRLEDLDEQVLSLEGVAMLMRKVRRDGVLCYHTSHKYFNVTEIVSAAAAELGLPCISIRDPHRERAPLGHFSSEWVLVAHDLAALRDFLQPGAPPEFTVERLRGNARHLWRDGAENTLRGLYFSEPRLWRLRNEIGGWEYEFRRATNWNSELTRSVFRGLRDMVQALDQSVVRELNRVDTGNNVKPQARRPGPGLQVRDRQFRDPIFGDVVQRTLTARGLIAGAQYVEPEQEKVRADAWHDSSRWSITYFHREGPVGLVLGRNHPFSGPRNTYPEDARLPCTLVGQLGGDAGSGLLSLSCLAGLWSTAPVLVIGLETGSLAGYATPLQPMHFIEHDPVLIGLSVPQDKGAPLFTYLRSALRRGADIRVRSGEPRAAVARLGDRFYTTIVVESYKGGVDSLRTEWLTQQGMKELVSKLSERGVLCYHVSNRYYDVTPIVAAAAAANGCACVRVTDQHQGWGGGHLNSDWVMVARRSRDLEPGERRPTIVWETPDVDQRFLWQDGAANSLRGLYRFDPIIGQVQQKVYEIQHVLSDRFSDRVAAAICGPIIRLLQVAGFDLARRRNRD
jgi:hypothetical protein